jgi:GT2 family glycosyltransferase
MSRQLFSNGTRRARRKAQAVRAEVVAEGAATGETPAPFADGQTSRDLDTAIEYRMDPGDAAAAGEGARPDEEGHSNLKALIDDGAVQRAPIAGGLPLDSSDGGLLAADVFDEAGYLRLNPDVRRAVEMGQIESGYAHYFWHGRVEGRALPDSPREARNTMLASPSDSGRLDVFPKEARCSLEALIISPKAGLMIVGWIDDASHPLSCIRIIGPDWRVVISSSHFLRVRRADVEKAIGNHRRHAFGFIGFLNFDHGGGTSGSVQVELWQSGGFSTVVQVAPTLVEDMELRDTILAHLAGASYFGNSSIESIQHLERGLGVELVRFNLAITRRLVSVPYVERFGPQGPRRRGTIVVCLYGKPEYFFLQNCLYSGLSGIDQYEFVYVSNSPEMAETLLREAQRASLLYALPITLVILPGNAGFGAANNVAAGEARSDRLLIVNPDVFPRDLDWAGKHCGLLDTAPPEQTQLFGVPLYYDDGSLMHGGIYFEVDVGLSLARGCPSPARMCRTEHYGKGAPASFVEFNRPRPVPAVTGAFISIARGWYEQLGGFTEDFIFGHYEDADLCLKSIAKGTPPWIHDIRMWHLEGKGSIRAPHHEGGSLVNRWLFSSRWRTIIEEGLLGPHPSHALMRSSAGSDVTQTHQEAPVKMAKHKRARS